MTKTRVLIVDDSVVVRRAIADAVLSDPTLEVVGVAATGQIGIAKIAQTNPDVVILDIEMPGMNGLDTLTEIRQLYARLPVIMCSASTQRGALVTLDAFARGASDCVAKPTGELRLAEAQQTLREQLVPKIKALCPRFQPCPRFQSTRPQAVTLPEKTTRTKSITPPDLATPPPKSRTAVSQIDVVAIGVSTGGPNALCEIIPAIPKSFPVPILIVQHMPALFTETLANRLDKLSEIRVLHGAHDALISAGTAYIAPGDFHMMARRRDGQEWLAINQDPPENSCRPAVDVLFQSVVDAYGAGVLGVILTGMGQDGLRGCQRIRDAGGQVIAQDEKSSVVWGMPGFVAKAGLADCILPLHQIAIEIHRRVQKIRSTPRQVEVGVCS